MWSVVLSWTVTTSKKERKSFEWQKTAAPVFVRRFIRFVGKKTSEAASVTVFGLVWTKTRHQKVQLRPIFWHFYRQIVGLTVLKQHLFRELCANEPVRAKRLRRSYGKPRKKHVSLMFYDRSLTSSAWFKKKAHRTEKRRKQTHEQARTHTAEGLTLKIEFYELRVKQ